MDKREKICEQQYLFHRYWGGKFVWIILVLIGVIVYINQLTISNPGSSYKWAGVIIILIIALYFIIFFILANRAHERWMECIGGKNWKKLYKGN